MYRNSRYYSMLCILLVPLAVPAALKAQSRVVVDFGVAADKWLAGSFSGGGFGINLESAVGLRTGRNGYAGLGIRLWLPPELGARKGYLLGMFVRGRHALGAEGKKWRPIIGGRAGVTLYGSGGFSEPYGGTDFGVELGLQHFVASSTLLAITLRPSWIHFSDDPGGFTLGLGISLIAGSRQ